MAFDSAFVRPLVWHGVQGLVWDALRPLRSPSEDPPSELAASAAAVAARNGLRLHEVERALGALVDARVTAVALKGLALVVDGYAHPGLRPMEDVDLLLREEDLGRAHRALLALGYESAVTESPDSDHHLAYRLRSAADLPDAIELHRRLFDAPPHDRLCPAAHVISRATHAPRPRSAGLLLPHPVDLALHIAGHTAIQHAGSERLIWIADLDRAVARGVAAGGAGFWDELWSQARGWDLAAALSDCLTAATTWFGTAVDIRPLSAAERAGYERARSRPPVGREGARVWHDARRAHGWRPRVLVVRRALFPPPAFMRSWYGLDRDVLLPLAYLRRWISGARELLAPGAVNTGAGPARWFVSTEAHAE
jgi:hypothetical protein